MAERWVDDGGNNTTGLSWATAYTSIQSLVAAEATFLTTSGNVVYFGHDSNCTAAGAALTITGPTTGDPVKFISLTQGGTTYQKGTGKQINTTGGNYTVTLDGNLALYGIRIDSGGTATNAISFVQTTPRASYLHDCTLAPGAAGGMGLGGNATKMIIRDMVIDLTSDGTINRTGPVINGVTGYLDLVGLTFVNAGYRTGVVLKTSTSCTGASISGCDFSGFTNATACEISGGPESSCPVNFTNCITKSSPTLFDTGSFRPAGYYMMTNVGEVDAPVSLAVGAYQGNLISTPSIYRNSGASVEGDACGWLITTTAVCNESSPFFTPYLYGQCDTTGSKNFDVYLTNDDGDLTDAEVWLELEYLGTADSPTWSRVDDHLATAMTTPAAQDDDTVSTWTGTGPAFTYKQRLRVTATIGETGMCRARVVFGKASIASSAYLYVDPLVVVS
jgi:hypothetical protein